MIAHCIEDANQSEVDLSENSNSNIQQIQGF